jgi:hypothetical protein
MLCTLIINCDQSLLTVVSKLKESIINFDVFYFVLQSIDMSYEKPSIDADPDFEIESVDFKTLDISPTASPAKKKVKAGDTKRERVIFYPSEIPVFSAEVQEIIKKDHLLFKTGEFVKQSAYFLRSLVEFPTPLEYTAYSRTLVEKYPILAQLPGDHDNNYVSYFFIFWYWVL